MVVINPNGGLGNQLFCYAVGCFLSDKLELPLRLASNKHLYSPESLKFLRFLSDPPKQIGYVSSWLYLKHPQSKTKKKLKLAPVILEEGEDWWNCPFNPEILERKVTIVNGVFSYPVLIDPILSLLKAQVNLLDSYRSTAFHRIEKEVKTSESVSVHIRRGDYLSQDYKHVFAELDFDYYRRAVNEMKSKLVSPNFYFFSNDLDFSRALITDLNISAKLVSAEHALTDLEEFQLMKTCKHHVIANSTFSWWAAQLGKDENSIQIAPQHWFKHPQAQSAYENQEILKIEAIKL